MVEDVVGESENADDIAASDDWQLVDLLALSNPVVTFSSKYITG